MKATTQNTALCVPCALLIDTVSAAYITLYADRQSSPEAYYVRHPEEFPAAVARQDQRLRGEGYFDTYVAFDNAAYLPGFCDRFVRGYHTGFTGTAVPLRGNPEEAVKCIDEPIAYLKLTSAAADSGIEEACAAYRAFLADVFPADFDIGSRLFSITGSAAR